MLPAGRIKTDLTKAKKMAKLSIGTKKKTGFSITVRDNAGGTASTTKTIYPDGKVTAKKLLDLLIKNASK